MDADTFYDALEGRGVDAGWHQDGAFLGADIRTVNLWVSLSDCGQDAPSLDLVARRVDRILPTGTEGAAYDWAVSSAVVEEVGAGAIVRPEFAPGDALFFDSFCVHQTGATPTMTAFATRSSRGSLRRRRIRWSGYRSSSDALVAPHADPQKFSSPAPRWSCWRAGARAGATARPSRRRPRQSQATVSTRPPVTAPTTTTSIPGPPLEPLILKDAPSGFTRQADSLAATGPVDLDKAVQDDPFTGETEARRLLLAAGFLQGYQRQWATEPGVSQNFIYVYQFETPEAAASYITHWRAAAVAGPTRSAPVPFTPGLPGAVGLKGNDERGSSGLVVFSKGPYAVQAVVTGDAGVDQSGPAAELALAQYALLP